MGWKNLSRREVEVLNAAAIGLTTKETAIALGIEFDTVHVYRRKARLKTGARSITHAVALAIYAGVVHRDFALPRRGRRPGGPTHRGNAVPPPVDAP